MRVEKPFFIEKGKQIRSISCGYGYTLIVDIWGKVWSMGFNNQGQLGLGHCNSNEQNE
jgi:alpha-tubulin suppressor-like RCC1 family protein